MKSRFRAHWWALLAGALLIALSASSALGAGPSGDEEKNHGQQVSEFVHSLLFDDETAGEDEDAPADEDVQDDEDTQDEEELADEVLEGGQPDNHGACVSAVATTHDEVGGENENHGGAVSEAARVTCWEDGADGEPTADEDATGDEEVTSEATDGDGHGKSAAAHERTRGRGHGKGHGGS